MLPRAPATTPTSCGGSDLSAFNGVLRATFDLEKRSGACRCMCRCVPACEEKVGKAAGERWKSLTESEKAPFVAKANKLKGEYNKAITAYNKGESTAAAAAALINQMPSFNLYEHTQKWCFLPFTRALA